MADQPTELSYSADDVDGNVLREIAVGDIVAADDYFERQPVNVEDNGTARLYVVRHENSSTDMPEPTKGKTKKIVEQHESEGHEAVAAVNYLRDNPDSIPAGQRGDRVKSALKSLDMRDSASKRTSSSSLRNDNPVQARLVMNEIEYLNPALAKEVQRRTHHYGDIKQTHVKANATIQKRESVVIKGDAIQYIDRIARKQHSNRASLRLVHSQGVISAPQPQGSSPSKPESRIEGVVNIGMHMAVLAAA